MRSTKIPMTRSDHPVRVPEEFQRAILQLGIRTTRYLLAISVMRQRMSLFEKSPEPQRSARFPVYGFRAQFVVSTSCFGTGQRMHSNQTPLGLHRIVRKAGGGYPIGTVFKNRSPIGFTWQGAGNGGIVHRILWLEGLEPGFNRGGEVDTFARYIYLHGFSDESTLGHPQSRGCIHLAAVDLIPLYDRVSEGTLVWIAER
jgi:hypothetical protein